MSNIQNINFLTLPQFRLPNGLPAVRSGSTMATAPVFLTIHVYSADSRICCSEEDLPTTLCSIFSSFLPFVSSLISLTEGEKWYKEGVNEVIQNYAKPYKDPILSVSFPLHF